MANFERLTPNPEGLRVVEVGQDQWRAPGLDSALRASTFGREVIVAVYNPQRGPILGRFSDPTQSEDGVRSLESFNVLMDLMKDAIYTPGLLQAWIGVSHSAQDSPEDIDRINEAKHYVEDRLKQLGIGELAIDFSLSGIGEFTDITIYGDSGRISMETRLGL